jgi:hypothetical protein
VNDSRYQLDIVTALFRAEGLQVIEDANAIQAAAAMAGTAPNSIPMMYIGNSVIVLNPDSDYWERRTEEIEKEFQDGFYSTNNINHDVWHEIGHVKHLQNNPAHYRPAQQAPIPSDIYAEVLEKISEYACFSCGEMVAEIYALLRFHQQGNTPPALSAELLQYYLDIGGAEP